MICEIEFLFHPIQIKEKQITGENIFIYFILLFYLLFVFGKAVIFTFQMCTMCQDVVRYKSIQTNPKMRPLI